MKQEENLISVFSTLDPSDIPAGVHYFGVEQSKSDNDRDIPEILPLFYYDDNISFGQLAELYRKQYGHYHPP